MRRDRQNNNDQGNGGLRALHRAAHYQSEDAHRALLFPRGVPSITTGPQAPNRQGARRLDEQDSSLGEQDSESKREPTRHQQMTR